MFSFVAIWGAMGSVLRKRLDAAGWLLLFSSMLNVCPIMLQRYNRIWLRSDSCGTNVGLRAPGAIEAE